MESLILSIGSSLGTILGAVIAYVLVVRDLRK